MELFLLAVVVVALVAFAIWYFSEAQRTLRRLKAHAAVSIRDVRDGVPVKIDGTLRLAEHTLHAPVSGRACAFYRLVIKEHRRSGKSSRWVTIVDDRLGTDFLLEDGTGRALVRASGPLVQAAIVTDGRQASGTFNDATPELEALLKRYGRSSTGLLGFNKALRYEEGVLEAGERVVVLGVGQWERDPDPSATAGYREKAQRLIMTGAPGESLLLADDPKAWGK